MYFFKPLSYPASFFFQVMKSICLKDDNTYRCIFYVTIIFIHQAQGLLFLRCCIFYFLNQKSSNFCQTKSPDKLATFATCSVAWCFNGFIKQPKRMMTRIIAAVTSMAPCQPKALMSLEDDYDEDNEVTSLPRPTL